MSSAASSAGGAERKGARTRRRILSAARRVFADLGYQHATVRGIAAAAGVDKSSIIQYFGSKQALFREAVYWDIPLEELSFDDSTATTESRTRAMLAAWAADPDSPMAVLVRTSMTSEDAAELLRTHITAQSIDPIAAEVDAPDARLRACLTSAMLMGIATQRYILRMPDLADAEVDDILRLVTPLIQTLLDPVTEPR
ncbi:TetR/AcrR family transcriptional regulator [Nocardia takedensis]